MEGKTISFLVLLCLPVLIQSGSIKDNQDNIPNSGITSRFIRDVNFIRSKRQNGGAICQEGSNIDCLPEGINNVPQSLVDCVAGQCVCNECFMEDDSSGRCATCSEYLYSINLTRCGVDNRPSQLTAFLLSLFLSSTGAANFYIGRNDLAGGQLFILCLLLVLSYTSCCLPCCAACCMAKEDIKGSFLFIFVIFLLIIIIIVCSFIMSAWWLADLIIFATNQRLSGNGCELNPTL